MWWRYGGARQRSRTSCTPRLEGAHTSTRSHSGRAVMARSTWGDLVEMWGRFRVDVGEMQGSHGGARHLHERGGLAGAGGALQQHQLGPQQAVPRAVPRAVLARAERIDDLPLGLGLG